MTRAALVALRERNAARIARNLADAAAFVYPRRDPTPQWERFSLRRTQAPKRSSDPEHEGYVPTWAKPL